MPFPFEKIAETLVLHFKGDVHLKQNRVNCTIGPSTCEVGGGCIWVQEIEKCLFQH